MEQFSFRLIDSKWLIAQMTKPLDTSVWRDLQNTLCGAQPVEWIGNVSHPKIIDLNDNMKTKLISICDNVKNFEDFSNFKGYINQQSVNLYLAFVRLGAFPDALENKNVFWYDECIECNKLFSVEKQLIDYLNYRRSDNRIESKNATK